MIFISDLDKTIVYSGFPSYFCVEYKDGKGVTYMTHKAYTEFCNLLKFNDFQFIPCTLRSFEQTSRICFINNELSPIIICDNGFSIYRKGKLDKEWDSMMQHKLKEYRNQEIYKIISEYIKSNKIIISQIKSNRDAFYTVIFKNSSDAELYYKGIISLDDKESYNTDLQGRKLYIIPSFLDKSLAVKHIIESMPKQDIITAGDSSVDKMFIQLGDTQIIPGHSSLKITNSTKTTSCGISAGEEIIDLIVNKYRQTHLF